MFAVFSTLKNSSIPFVFQLRIIPQGNNFFVDEFRYSVKMSTYLVAFMILPNDYKSINGTTTTGVKVSLSCPLKRNSCRAILCVLSFGLLNVIRTLQLRSCHVKNAILFDLNNILFGE